MTGRGCGLELKRLNSNIGEDTLSIYRGAYVGETRY